ncbi:MAG: 5-formyltetrahydrofolate cyclo-ligase [Atopobiaceae bacterium]|nr:5-formyltetrahydrofolate cyclo-ligase [Atopobiaceae bacterium]
MDDLNVGEPGGTEIKKQLRVELRALRDSLNEQERLEADSAITRQVLSLPEYASAMVIFSYLSVGSEIETREIMKDAWSKGKKVAIPKVVRGTRGLKWYVIDSFDDLVEGAYGVLEPSGHPADLQSTKTADVVGGAEAMLALVPGLAFTPTGFRIGYGGGYYDTFLRKFEGTSVGLCRESQMTNQIDGLERHDLPVDIVVCEHRILRPLS